MPRRAEFKMLEFGEIHGCITHDSRDLEGFQDMIVAGCD